MTHLALKNIPHYDSGGSVGANTTSGGGGIGNIGSLFTNQSGYQAQLAPTTNIDYTGANASSLAGVNQGATQSNQLLTQQQQLANQLQQQSLGNGPNPAQTALNQNTANNVNSAAAIAAGTRGAGSNAGLVAMNAANAGANAQQQAVGQAATLQSNQELQATQALQGQQEAETGNIQGEQGIQGNLYGASANANNAQNNTAIANYNQAQGLNAQTAQNNASAVNQGTQGLFGGVGAALGAIPGLGFLGFSEGGKVPKEYQHLHHMAKIYHPHLFAGGGAVNFGVGESSAPSVNVPNFTQSSSAPSGLSDLGQGIGDKITQGEVQSDVDQLNSQLGGVNTGNPVGGEVTAPAYSYQAGGQVAGKPKVAHDAYKNDTVPAMLSPGEVVIPLDVLHDKSRLGKMAQFVAKEIARKKAGRKLA